MLEESRQGMMDVGDEQQQLVFKQWSKPARLVVCMEKFGWSSIRPTAEPMSEAGMKVIECI